MLQSVVFGNVGLFKDTNVIKCSRENLTGGLGILVGINGSGKSMACECIRRCLDTGLSHSKTQIPDAKKASYILCQYELDPKVVRKLQEQANNDTVKEFLTNLPEEAEIMCITGILDTEKNKCSFKFLELSVGNDSLFLVGKANDENVYNYKRMQSDLLNITNSFISHLDEKQDDNVDIKELKRLLDDNAWKQDNDDFNMVFKQLLGIDSAVTFIYPHRGIGSAMGSHAKEMRQKSGLDNYENAVQSAQMMIDYWKCKEEDKNISDDYDKILNDLIPNCPYTLSIETAQNGKENAFLKDLDNPESGKVHLLKIPEGIFEVMLFCLCLATRGHEYVTICYDEPSRCMHEQLVGHLSSYIIELVKKHKICLVIPTHSPCFITEESWKNITYFQRRYGTLQCKTLQNDQFSISQIRYFSKENIRTLIFAYKILMVEGESDKIFIQKLLAYLKSGTHLSKFSEDEKNDIIENHVKYGDIKVIDLGGKENMEKVSNLCKLLNISFRILYDRDKREEKESMKTGIETELGHDVMSGITYFAKNVRERKCFEKAATAIKTFLNSLWTKDDSQWADDGVQFTATPANINSLLKSLGNVSVPIDAKKKQMTDDKGLKKEEIVPVISCLERIKEFTDRSKSLTEISKDQVRKLTRLLMDIAFYCPGTTEETGMEFYWTSNALEEALGKCTHDADKPLLARSVIDPQFKTPHKQYIWYLDKKNEAPGHIKSFTCEEMDKLTEFVLDNATEEIRAFVMFLTNFADKA